MLLLFSDSFTSATPLPSISSRYIDPNKKQTKLNLKQSINNLINESTSIKSNISNLLRSNDPSYNSLILKILEAKALDCLCQGYSKKNTERQISNALYEINQRFFFPLYFSQNRIQMIILLFDFIDLININGLLKVLHQHDLHLLITNHHLVHRY